MDTVRKLFISSMQTCLTSLCSQQILHSHIGLERLMPWTPHLVHMFCGGETQKPSGGSAGVFTQKTLTFSGPPSLLKTACALNFPSGINTVSIDLSVYITKDHKATELIYGCMLFHCVIFVNHVDWLTFTWLCNGRDVIKISARSSLISTWLFLDESLLDDVH